MSTREAEQSSDYWAWLRYARLSRPGDEPPGPPAGEPPPELLQRLAPLIYHNVYRFDHANRLPEALLARLQQSSLQTVTLQAVYRHWLSGFGERLARRGLKAILLKGSAFNGWLYPDNAPRYAVDIDLWVPPAQFDATCELMMESHQPLLLDEARKATHRRLFERVFTARDRGPTVEIHRGLTNPYLYRVDPQQLQAEAVTHPGYGNPALQMLDPYHGLLHLALHATRDRDFANYGVLDTHELWCRTAPEPAILLKKARQWQACTPLYHLLRNAAHHLETPVPEELLATLRPAPWRRGLAARTARLSASPDLPPAGRLVQVGANFALSDRLGNALRFQWDYLMMRLADLGSR